jgi:antitoxin (DNA-binding transcriptional repressor) of toxin-antitoxin stability system
MRTKEQLIQKIDDELIWRRKELSDFKAVIQQQAQNPLRLSVLLRAGVTLLYAHWEGFVKISGTYYLQYVAAQRRPGLELRANFIAIKLKSQISEASKSKKISSAEQLIDFFCTRLADDLKIPHKGIVDTEANLSSSVLKEILWILGLERTSFETKSVLIDKSLVARRNFIAHGEPLDIELDDYLDLHDEVLSMIATFRTLLQNAAVQNEFLRSHKPVVTHAVAAEDIVIAKHGKPMVRLVPVSSGGRVPGSAKGKVSVAKDFDKIPAGFKDYV